MRRYIARMSNELQVLHFHPYLQQEAESAACPDPSTAKRQRVGHENVAEIAVPLVNNSAAAAPERPPPSWLQGSGEAQPY